MEPLRPLLGRWLMREQEAASALQRLGMEEAAAAARQDAACLKGILVLLEQPLPKPVPVANSCSLRQIYGESLRLRCEYEANADHGEYGCVLGALAERKTQRCLALLRRMGKG